MKYPDLTHEISLWKNDYTVIGVDEVGRGCLAGPVYVAACTLRRREDMGNHTSLVKKIQNMGIQDSKKISPKKRKDLASLMRVEGVEVALSYSSVNDINSLGIVKATKNAAQNAVSKLIQQLSISRPYVLSDAYYIQHTSNRGPTPERAIIRGDEKSISIASASIFAKVARDEYMMDLSEKFPYYFWEKNKGYGTKLHRNAILNSGTTSHHRKKFVKNLIISAKT